MKGVIDILYKWCGALHRGAVRTFTDGYNRRSLSLEFVGGSVTITKYYSNAEHPVYTPITFDYSGSEDPQTETWTLISRQIVLKVEATGCRYLKVGDDVLIPMH